ncbi:MAG: hypothetical protein ACF8R7_15015 [Phycisphaerales bacterium JB039]
MDDSNQTTAEPRRARASGAGLAAGLYVLAYAIAIAAFFWSSGWIGDLAFRPMTMASSAALMILGLMLLPVVVLLVRIRRSQQAITSSMGAMCEDMRRFAEQVSLSDDARRVLNRKSEGALLRRAIEEDIASEDWEAATVLIKELAERFGYRADAEEFRSRVERSRSRVQDRAVADAISTLDGLIVQRRWDAALVEAARIGRLYPDSPRVDGLRRRVEQARDTYRQDLERRFLEAAQLEDVDEALELMKELDAYVSETEAAPLREVARGVIGKARENLGAQFKLAVKDRQWDVAASIGERIMAEFPNTRMANEAREMLEAIRERAAKTTSSATA